MRQRPNLPFFYFFIFILSLFFIGIPSVAATTVTIGDVCSEKTVTATIMINDVKDVASATIKLSYDPSIIVVASIGNSDFPAFIPNIAFAEEGWVMMTGFKTGGGLSGDVKFAEITIAPRGSAGQISKLDLNVEKLSDSGWKPISASVVDGHFGVVDCDALNDCYTYRTGCEDRIFYCSGGRCRYRSANKHTDYYGKWVEYCSGDTVRKHRRFYDYYCEAKKCTAHGSWTDDQLVENCNDHDGWYDTGKTQWVTTKEYDCKYDQKEQKEQEYRDFSCSSGSCTHEVSGTPKWLDTGKTRTLNKADGTDCGSDYYDDFVNYCKSDSVWKHRLFHDFSCSSGSCTDHKCWTDDQLVENCSDHDGWYDTGKTHWVQDAENECLEKEQKEQEYRDFSCSAGSCEYCITGTKWVETGKTRDRIRKIDVSPERWKMNTSEEKQFSALATLTSGGTENVTLKASWSSSDTSVLEHLEGGRFRAKNKGTAEIFATYCEEKDNSTVIVIPPPTPTVSISTDKEEYHAGDTMSVTINFKNPTSDSIKTYFVWHLGLLDFGYWAPMMLTELTLPPNSDKTYIIPIAIGNWGMIEINARWYVAILETTVPYKIISQDTADWKYAPTKQGYEEKTPEEIAKEITKKIKNVEFQAFQA